MGCPEDLVAHMRRVLVAERDLHDLGVVWQLIESSAAISCPAEAAAILPTLIGTRERFDSLHQRLTAQMAGEYQAELADELGAKAQCTIDILVRNLYERAADVGFLATDDRVRAYCAATAEARSALRPAMQARLADYQRKYTVYDDVILCGLDGCVLARLDERAPEGLRSQEPLIAQAQAADGFCERFGASDLGLAGEPATLLYAHRIHDGSGRLLGVLVLRFRFVDEMGCIFSDVGGERGAHIALMLVDAQQRVIASSDPAHVPLGARMAVAAAREGAGMQITQFAGREYLASHCAGTPYQGYAGPAGWRAVAMVSLLTAFSGRREAEATEEDFNGVLGHGALGAIRDDADAINRELRRVVWNGRLMARAQSSDRLRLTAVLRQVSAAGVRTQARVDQAIADIGRTALARSRQRAHEMGRLAADILDRSLYERANDCRWWALSPRLREALASADPVDSPGLSALLDHLNSLYTVYSRLVVFDREGQVCAASGGASGQALIGSSVPPEMRAAVEALSDAQRYAVTGFEHSPWHDQGATYTFMAAVRAPADERQVVGGIAIVFNAAREFRAILDDIRGERDGFAAFVDAQGQVLCASGDVAPEQLAFEGSQGMTARGRERYLCARAQARGYREFKQQDGYDNGVFAVVGLKLGPMERRSSRGTAMDLQAVHPVPADKTAAQEELALFRVGGVAYGLPAQLALEAAPQQGLVRTPGAGPARLGLLEVGQPEQGPQASQLIPVWCARALFGITWPARKGDGVVLVLRAAGPGQAARVGLRVDQVLSVLELDPRRYHPAPAGFQAFAPWVSGMVECRSELDGQPELVQRLDLPALLQACGMAPTWAEAPLPGAPWPPAEVAAADPVAPQAA